MVTWQNRHIIGRAQPVPRKAVPNVAPPTFLCRFLQIRSRWWCKYGHGGGANTVTPSHGSSNHCRTHVDCEITHSLRFVTVFAQNHHSHHQDDDVRSCRDTSNTQLPITTNDNRSPSASKHSYGLICEGRTLIHHRKHLCVLCRKSPCHRPATSILWTIQI